MMVHLAQQAVEDYLVDIIVLTQIQAYTIVQIFGMGVKTLVVDMKLIQDLVLQENGYIKIM